MPLVITYVPLWGHNIGTALQLDGHYGATIWPLIRYYRFDIHIKCEFINFKLDPNVTLKIFILKVHQSIQAYTPRFFIRTNVELIIVDFGINSSLAPIRVASYGIFNV
jgi:hypothetical protein